MLVSAVDVSVTTDWVTTFVVEGNAEDDCSVEKLIVMTEEILIVIDNEAEEVVALVVVISGTVIEGVDILEASVLIVDGMCSSVVIEVVTIVILPVATETPVVGVAVMITLVDSSVVKIDTVALVPVSLVRALVDSTVVRISVGVIVLLVVSVGVVELLVGST